MLHYHSIWAGGWLSFTYESDHVGGTIPGIKAANLGSCLPKDSIVCCYLQQTGQPHEQCVDSHHHVKSVNQWIRKEGRTVLPGAPKTCSTAETFIFSFLNHSGGVDRQSEIRFVKDPL